MEHLGCSFSRFGGLELVVGSLLVAGSCERPSLVAVPVTEKSVSCGRKRTISNSGQIRAATSRLGFDIPPGS